jgi:hypothetical protein
MIRNHGNRAFLAAVGKEFADLVGHVDELVRRHTRAA